MAKSIIENMESYVSGLLSANSLSEVEIAEKLNNSSYAPELKKNHNALW